MVTIPEALSAATQQHQAGQLQAAEQIYRQILAVEPDHPHALHQLGLLAHQSGRPDVAVEFVLRAIAICDSEAVFHNSLGEAYRALQRDAEAIACYERALQLWPNAAQFSCNLGMALNNTGRRAEAIDAFCRALALQPDFISARYNLGNTLYAAGRLSESVECYRQVVLLDAAHAAAHYNMGVVFSDQGKLEEACACFERAVQVRPDDDEAHNNLGTVWRSLGQTERAIGCFQRSVQIQPRNFKALNNLGSVWNDLGHSGQAVACFQQALEVAPHAAALHNNLGNALRALGQIDNARSCFERALQLAPDLAEAHHALGHLWKQKGRVAEAIACYQRAVQLEPDHPAPLGDLVHLLQHACDWRELPDLTRRAIDGLSRNAQGGAFDPMAPFSCLAFVDPASTAAQQLQCAQQRARGILHRAASTAKERSSPLVSVPKSVIRIGYLSPDFREHPVARCVVELFEQHDRSRVTLTGYSTGPDDGSALRKRVAGAVDRFVDLQNATDAEAAERIAADGVEILVDLAGYTGEARTAILAQRPAPVQVNYLGYPGTTGAEFIDYILVDDFVVPAGRQPFFSEKLVHLPECFMVRDGRMELAGQPPSRSACGLPEQGVVFCAFNNSFKIGPAIFNVWMELLKETPGSVLWISEANALMVANLRNEAAARGVATDRLVFAPRLPGLAEHLARYRLADLFLDTFPYNAHATACDALWAGCPVLTCSGESFASRVAGSLLRTVGLPELITSGLDEYRDMALRLARDSGQRAALRDRLQTNGTSSPLFDSTRFARNIEQAYETMRENARSGAPPRAFAVQRTDRGA